MNLEKEVENNQEIIKNRKERENFIESIQNYAKEMEKKQDVKLIDTASIDRIEGEIAVCELLDGNMVDIPVANIPFSIKDGDILKVELNYKDGKIDKLTVLEKDEEERKRRVEYIQKKVKEIRNKRG